MKCYFISLFTILATCLHSGVVHALAIDVLASENNSGAAALCNKLDGKPDVLALDFGDSVGRNSLTKNKITIWRSVKPVSVQLVPAYKKVTIREVKQHLEYPELFRILTDDGALTMHGHNYRLHISEVKFTTGSKPLKDKLAEFIPAPLPTLVMGERYRHGETTPSRDLIEAQGVSHIINTTQPLNDSLITLTRKDKRGFTYELPIRAIRPKGGSGSDVLEIQLAHPLPYGENSTIKATLQVCPAVSAKPVALKALKVTGKSAPLSVPSKRTDENVALYLDVAYVDDGTKEQDSGEGLLDILGRVTLWDAGALDDDYKRVTAFLDADIGTNNPKTSTAPNTVKLGMDFTLKSAPSSQTGNREDHWNIGITHHSDRDLKTRELVIPASYTPFFYSLNRSTEQTAKRDIKQGSKTLSIVHAWSVIPTIGIEVGQLLQVEENAANTKGIPTTEGNSFVRGVLSLTAGVSIKDWSLSIDNTLRLLDQSDDRTRNIISASLGYQFSAATTLALEHKSGHDVPTFEKVKTTSVVIKLRY